MSASDSMKSTRDAFIEQSKSCEKVLMNDSLSSGKSPTVILNSTGILIYISLLLLKFFFFGLPEAKIKASIKMLEYKYNVQYMKIK